LLKVTLNSVKIHHSISPLASLFDCVWETKKTGKNITPPSLGKEQISSEGLELSSDSSKAEKYSVKETHLTQVRDTFSLFHLNVVI